MAERKGITLRKNEAGKGYYDIWYRGVHSRLYTGILLTDENRSWFGARETLVLEMIQNGTFELEKARVVIGIASQRQKRTEQKIDITVQEFGQEWLEHKKTSISVDKVYEYGNILDLICSTSIALPGKKKTHITVGSLRIREFRAQYVDLLVNTLRERQGIKGPTMSNTRLNDILLRVVRPLLDLAYQREYLDKNPHEWVQKRRAEHPDDIDPFSFDEMMIFMAALPDAKWVRYYTIAFGTGLRPSEQNALEWEHIDFTGKTILVRQGVVRGRKTLLKTKGSRRDVDMLPMVEEALRSHLEATDGKGQYVFSNARGGPLFQEGMRRRVWTPTVERAGLRHRNAYQTRHTFATLMLS
jgi:integrase